MPRTVQFDDYGPLDVLEVRDVPRPVPGDGEVLVRVKAAGLNPGENTVREGVFHERWPATFPSGQGSDLAGVVDELGPGVTTHRVGDEVVGWVDTRAAQAELVVVPAGQLVPRVAGVSWEAGGGLFVAGTTAVAAVRAVGAGAGDTVVVAGAAGGVGSLAVQLARRAGARVLGLASPANHDWLAAKGVEPLAYGDGVAERIRAAAPGGVDALIDLFGGGYVDLALDELGVAPERVDTIIDFEAAARRGVQAKGQSDAATAETLAELVGLVGARDLEVPIQATYPLAQVREAYADLLRRHARGKIVLLA